MRSGRGYHLGQEVGISNGRNSLSNSTGATIGMVPVCGAHKAPTKSLSSASFFLPSHDTASYPTSLATCLAIYTLSSALGPSGQPCEEYIGQDCRPRCLFVAGCLERGKYFSRA